LKKTTHFVSTKIENRGERIVNKLRFELPVNGYFEIYLNQNLIKKGPFSNNIEIGELRSSNTVSLKIWSFSHISEYTSFQYTHENGFIIPSVLKPIKKGVFFWIYNNPYNMLFFCIIAILILALNILAWMPVKNKQIEISNA
jgi:hypothetical protein